MNDAEPDAVPALDHLQAAARELIAAFRSVLDAAEELVEDPEAMNRTVGAFGDLARRAARQAAAFVADPSMGGAEEPDGVEHIDLG